MSRFPSLRIVVALALLLVGVSLPIVGAQSAPATQTPAAPSAADRLPVRRVVLYKSGVGYFEHLGKVRGNQSVTIDFTSGQLDDVLKSLTTLDLDGGRVSGVGYNSDAALGRRLEALRLPIGEAPTRAQYLSALRGARLEYRDSGTRVVGRLLSVERIDRKADGSVTQVDMMTLITDAGAMVTLPLDAGAQVTILDPDLAQEVAKYLALVASARDQDQRRLTISTAGTGERDLFVSYVSEVPVWKATYRLVLPSATDTRKPLLQGWAIVDNTVGQDWENVELSLVSGAPQSFIQRVSQPYYVQRPVVPLPERALLSPQTHQTAMTTGGLGALTGTLTDQDRGVIPGAQVRVTRGGAQVGTTSTDGSGRYRLPNVSPGSYDVTFSMTGFRPLTRSGVEVTGGMETVLNAALTVAAVNESVTAAAGGQGRGGGGGRQGNVSGLPQGSMNVTIDGVTTSNNLSRADGFFATVAPRPEAVSEAMFRQAAEASGGQLGDLFEYKLKEPITIRKNQSSLVPIVAAEIAVDKVSLWNATSSRSNRALRAVWLTNSTTLTLDGGSFTVVEGQAFAGEGLIESLKPGEKRLLSYAIDLGVQVDTKAEPVPLVTTKIVVNRGLVIQTTEERQKRVYTLRNEDTEPRVVVVEHPVRAGWTVSGTMSPVETTPSWYRYRVSVAPKVTSTFTVEEMRPSQSQLSINSITDDQVALLVRTRVLAPAIETALRDVITRKREIARLDNELSAKNNEVGAIGTDQERIRENMRSLKGSSEERALLQRYIKQLNDQEDRLKALSGEIDVLRAQRAKAVADLNTFIEGLSIGG